MAKTIGTRTIEFEHSPSIIGYAAVGSQMEKDGPLGSQFDKLYDNPLAGQQSWEKAESELQKTALGLAMEKSGFTEKDMDYVFAGDLLNQCIGSSFGVKSFGIPFCGLYGACSTMALSMILASVYVDGGIANQAAAITSSHFCSAERQYRFPLEYGGQRPPTAQWTATASGAVIIGNTAGKAKVKRAILGTIEDLGVTDANNMGAAMAPAAAKTIAQFLKDTKTTPEAYNAIYTGDLGQVGSDLLYQLLDDEGMDIRKTHKDCGLLLYDRKKQDVHAGGSGCGCSAAVLCTQILNAFSSETYDNVLFCATGALLSPTTVLQGENIPSIAHLVQITK